MSTLDYWRRQVRDGNRARLVPVRIEAEEPAIVEDRCAGFQLSLPNGVRIESGWDFPEQGMARLLRVAAER